MIVMQMEWEGVTREDYDRVMDELRLDENVPSGAILHLAGGEGGTWRVTDVWESAEAFGEFTETQLKPALERAGLADRDDPKITIYPLHNVYAPNADDLVRQGARAGAGAGA